MSNNIVQFNEEIIKGQIKELVRGSVEETLNELLKAEAPKPVELGEIENTTDADKNACGGTLDVKDEHLVDKLLTEEEKKEVQAGDDINIHVTVEDISDKVSVEDKAAVEKNLNGMKVGLCLDINLEKQAGNCWSKVGQMKNSENFSRKYIIKNTDICVFYRE